MKIAAIATVKWRDNMYFELGAIARFYAQNDSAAFDIGLHGPAGLGRRLLGMAGAGDNG